MDKNSLALLTAEAEVNDSTIDKTILGDAEGFEQIKVVAEKDASVKGGELNKGSGSKRCH